jgi:hypothetical protein
VKEEPDGFRYKPGQLVPRTGIYRIYHRSHRLMHEATLIEKTYFPRCKRCKSAVRFELARPVQAENVLPFRPTELLEECDERVS